MTKDGMLILINLLTVWLLIEAYIRPPQGFHGPAWFVAFAYTIIIAAIIMLMINTMVFAFNYFLGSADVKT